MIRYVTSISLVILAASASAHEPEAADPGFNYREAISNLEHRPSRQTDPHDHIEKNHLTNREKNLRSYITDGGVWSIEDRMNSDAFRLSLTVDGFSANEKPKMDEESIRDATGPQ